MPLAISLSQTSSSWAALAAVLGFLLLLYFAGAKFASLAIGEDGRTSTSKCGALLWTLLLAWALLTLTLQGETGFDLVPDYLALLGFPALAMVFAKGIVQQKLDQGDIAKPPPPTAPADPAAAPNPAKPAAVQAPANPGPNPAQGGGRSFFNYIGDIVNNDSGKADIVDFQYVVFNLVAATYFLVNFINTNEMPQIPETLLALTGLSAGTYVTNKALLKQKPTLTGVSPGSAAPGAPIELRGINLGGQGAKPDGTPTVTDVKFDSTSVAAESVDDDAVTVKVPGNVEGYVADTPKAVQICVLNAAGLESNKIAFTII